MKDTIFITLLLSVSIVTIASADESYKITDSEVIDAYKHPSHDILTPRNQTYFSSGGDSENTGGIISDGIISKDIYSNPEISAKTASNCTTTWWISGNHRWSWKSFWAYLEIKLNGSSWTRHGSTEGPCEIPLLVDKIEISGYTTAWNNIATGKARINGVAYNTNTIQKSGKDKLYGINLTKGPCGAVVLHRATKNGVTWNTVTQSGCGGLPGTY